MKITTLKKSWSFDVDGEKWTVSYSFSSKYWHVSNTRKQVGQFRNDSQQPITKNHALIYLNSCLHKELFNVITETNDNE